MSVVPWEEVVDAGLWVAVNDPCEDIGEVGLRVDIVELASLD